jgi:hypothetical protein
VADAVTYIPGYANLEQFSKDYQKEIESALEAWQISDGGIGFGWVRGITGKPKGNPDSLQKTMDDLYDRIVNKHQIVYQMLGMSGPEAHAWLVVDIKKIDNGYKFTVIDSNYLSMQEHTYYTNENSLKSYGGVMLYNSRNFESVYKSIETRFCKLDISNLDIDQVKNR